MRALSHFIVLVAVLLSPPSLLWGETQQAGINARGIVESAEISGIDENDISPEIRSAVGKLVGQPFDQQAADGLVSRIQAEKADFSATTRLLPGDQPDRVKVIFFLERINTEPDSEANVNSRYMVERIEVQGYEESKLSQSIRDEMKTLVGERLDPDKADHIQRRIEDQLRPRHSVSRHVVKGSDRQHIVVVYEVKNARWIPFIAQPTERFLYHSKQNFSAVVGADILDRSNARFHVGLVDDQDELLERFAGFNATLETTKIATDRLGLALRYGRYHERWQPATVLAGRNDIYRERSTFDPSVTFAFDPRFRLTAGVSLSDLQIQYPAIHNNVANAAVFSLDFQNVWGHTDTAKQSLDAKYELRAGNHNLDSDFIYTRHLAQTRYAYGDKKTQLVLRFSGGTISGTAPLFERFSLGDTTTLRGWNKFDVAPLGGNRMASGTVQFEFGSPGHLHIQTDAHPKLDLRVPFVMFYDAGAVGDRGSPIKLRHSAGFGIGSTDSSGFFFGLGFPIRSGHVVPVLMTGFRF